jgi:hypothetical protein
MCTVLQPVLVCLRLDMLGPLLPWSAVLVRLLQKLLFSCLCRDIDAWQVPAELFGLMLVLATLTGCGVTPVTRTRGLYLAARLYACTALLSPSVFALLLGLVLDGTPLSWCVALSACSRVVVQG